MIRTGMREIIELIRKHQKIRRILRCESPSSLMRAKSSRCYNMFNTQGQTGKDNSVRLY